MPARTGARRQQEERRRQRYAEFLTALGGSNNVGVYTLTEPVGATIAVDGSGRGNHGAYGSFSGSFTGLNLAATAFKDGSLVPLSVVANRGFVDLYSAGFAADFDPQLFTVGVWIKRANTNNTDQRYVRIGPDSSNRLIIAKTTVANQVTFIYSAAGTSKTVNATISGTNWSLYVMTVNKAQDRMRAYVDGVQVGTDQTALGTWNEGTSPLTADDTAIGTTDTDTGAEWIDGSFGVPFVWNKEATAAEVAQAWAFFP